jgi:hypothetical protein
VTVPLSSEHELKAILSGIVASGRYESLRKHVQVAAEAFKYVSSCLCVDSGVQPVLSATSQCRLVYGLL